MQVEVCCLPQGCYRVGKNCYHCPQNLQENFIAAQGLLSECKPLPRIYPLTGQALHELRLHKGCQRKKTQWNLLEEDVTRFWKEKFSLAYPERLEGRGLSMLKQLLAEQLLDCILVDVKTHFKSRLTKLVAVTLRKSATDHESAAHRDTRILDNEAKRFTKEEKSATFAVTTKVCTGKWDGICPSVASVLKEVLPTNVKNNVNYDLVKNPSRYIESTLLISRVVGKQWGGV